MKYVSYVKIPLYDGVLEVHIFLDNGGVRGTRKTEL